MRDIFGLPAAPGLASLFTPDVMDSPKNSEALSVADQLRLDYQRGAEAIARQVSGSPALLATLVPAGAPSDSAGRARAFVTELGSRVHRRPLSETDIAAYLALFQSVTSLEPPVDSFVAGAQVVIEAMLQSPAFLYRSELGPAGARLSDYELASKLSYALVDSGPDKALLQAAAAGALQSKAGLEEQARRLLRAAGDHTTQQFHRALFEYEAYATIDKDPKIVAEWRPELAESMRQEAERFLADVSRSGTFSQILTAPFTYVDANLAPIYGVAAPASGEFVRVELNRQERAGFLTHSGYLAQFAGSRNPSPVHRGVFVMERVLCRSLPPPTTTKFPDPPRVDGTNRDLWDAFTGPGTCAASCHIGVGINLAGYAFESYDSLGFFRTEDNGRPVNASATFTYSEGARAFQNGVEFSQQLAESKEPHQCYARHWLSFLQGRNLRSADLPLLRTLATASKEGQLIKELVTSIVTHDSFAVRMP